MMDLEELHRMSKAADGHDLFQRTMQPMVRMVSEYLKIDSEKEVLHLLQVSVIIEQCLAGSWMRGI